MSLCTAGSIVGIINLNFQVHNANYFKQVLFCPVRSLALFYICCRSIQSSVEVVVSQPGRFSFLFTVFHDVTEKHTLNSKCYKPDYKLLQMLWRKVNCSKLHFVINQQSLVLETCIMYYSYGKQIVTYEYFVHLKNKQTPQTQSSISRMLVLLKIKFLLLSRTKNFTCNLQLACRTSATFYFLLFSVHPLYLVSTEARYSGGCRYEYVLYSHCQFLIPSTALVLFPSGF